MNKGETDIINKLFPTSFKIENKEYKDEIFMIELPKDGEKQDLKIRHFTGYAVTGDTHPTQPIRFYAKVIGFEDANALIRNWGMQHSTFRGYMGMAFLSRSSRLRGWIKRVLGYLYEKL